MTKVLYISYDGILEPLGQSQVLAYLLKLAVSHRIRLISYEKPSDFKQVQVRADIESQLKQAGIDWHPLSYHKAPSGLATGYDIAIGIVKASWLIYKYKIRIVHTRSYVASVIALPLKKMFKIRFIFDMRGFWADERIDGNIWQKNSRTYSVAKWFERRFLLSADHVISLTQAGVDMMKSFPYLQQHTQSFSVITTCTDLDFFDYQRFPNTVVNKSFTLGYVGSAGVWYLFDETLECFKLLLSVDPQAKLRILNKGEHAYIQDRLLAHGIEPSSVTLISAEREQVAFEMNLMDAGIFFIKPVYSKIASAPTKLGEFLGCGTPCLTNHGVGDMAPIIESNHVGVTVSEFSSSSLLQGITELLVLCQEPDIQKRCRDTALRYFSLDDGVEYCADIYKQLAEN